jgi:probable phosphoglycerate mutase
MRLIIVRHGQTDENVAGIIQGHLPGKLTKEGIEQAKKLALRLKTEKIDHIFSSDLARTADTAKEIARYHPKIPIEFVVELRERNLGEKAGRNKHEIGWDPHDYRTTEPTPKGGESMEELFDRAQRFLRKVLSKHPNDTVLFAGHNGINKAMIAAVMGKKWDEIRTLQSHKNTSVSIFEIDESRNHTIHLMGCVNHLE